MTSEESDRTGIERRIREYVERSYPEILPIDTAWARDEEHSAWELTATGYESGAMRRVVFDNDLLESPDYQRFVTLAQRVANIGPTPYRIEADGATRTVPTARHLLLHVLEVGSHGLYIQRYKGLGEMNPEQLWETTMDPERRTLLQVRIEDGVEADETFSVLMGDAVEPRKLFIEKNALNAENLDI